jgi:hypothetical protein
MEKIHGSSAHISFNKVEKKSIPYNEKIQDFENNVVSEAMYTVKFFSGGEKYENFTKIFNEQFLIDKFKEMGVDNMVIYGEVYGGKCQGMSATYGKDMKFVAFEVKIGDSWLSVPQADGIVKQFGLDFVHYEEVDTNIETLNRLCEADSVQAVRNGICPGKLREGIVLRPLIELKKNNGERIIAKHKNDKFKETTKKREISPDKFEILTKANEIADEWCTEMRLSHVLDQFPDADITKTGEVIKVMIDDIIKEGKDEIVDSKEARAAIGKKTAMMFKRRITKL